MGLSELRIGIRVDGQAVLDRVSRSLTKLDQAGAFGRFGGGAKGGGAAISPAFDAASEMQKKTQDKVTRSYNKSVFAWLGVMFGAMAAQRALNGLMRPAMDLAGIFDMIEMALSLFFLPAMLALLDFLMPILDAFLGLDENLQLLIGEAGIIALFAAGIVAAGAQLTLFAAGAKAALAAMGVGGAAGAGGAGGAGGAAGAAGGAGLAGLAGTTIAGILLLPVLIAIAAVLSQIDALWKAVSTTAEGLRMIIDGGIKQALFGVIEILMGIATFDWNRILNGIKMIFQGAVTYIAGVLTLAWGLVVDGLLSITLKFLNGLFTGLLGLIDAILGTQLKTEWVKITSGFEKAIDDAIKGMKLSFDNFFAGLRTAWNNLWSGVQMPNVNLGGGGGRWVPWFQQGGYVPDDTLAYLHAGEYVVPKAGMLVGGAGSSSNTMNVYIGSVSGRQDEEALLEKIKQLWSSEMRRLGVA